MRITGFYESNYLRRLQMLRLNSKIRMLKRYIKSSKDKTKLENWQFMLSIIFITFTNATTALAASGAPKTTDRIMRIVVVCFIAVISITILNAMGFGQAASMITFIAVCLVLLESITVFNDVYAAMRKFMTY